MKLGLSPAVVAWLATVMVFSAAAAPVIQKQPAALTVNAGSTALFTVSATNSRPTLYQWQFKGTNLPGETNLTLLIENVKTNQAGAYRVLVSDSSSTIASSPATLTILQGTIVRFALAAGNVDVELFDHDKPVTVQNFLHYVKAGIYTNTFFHRLVPNFVLQGGGFGTTNRADEVFSSDKLETLSQSAYYSGQSFAPYIQNEFSVGPVVHNTFGTIAMARSSNTNGVIYTNSANSQWFFNLADNSTNLDNVSGGFTVFGRVISGTDALQSFNQLSKGQGILDLTTNEGAVFSDLPARSSLGTNTLISGLYFANISLRTQPKFDSVSPTVSITFPTANSHFTNGTFTMRGTIKDAGGLGYVDCWLWRYTSKLTYLNPVQINGLQQWSADLNLAPGPYLVAFRAWDGYGNLTQSLLRFTVQTKMRVDISGQGKVVPDLNGKFVEAFSQYSVTAIPGPGQIFARWDGNNVTAFSPKLNFYTDEQEWLRATFVTNTFPKLLATYNGLFFPNNSTNSVDATNSGYFTITTTGTGGYNGKMLLAGATLPFSGQFDYLGSSSLLVKIPKSSNVLSLTLNLDMTNGTGTVVGKVNGQGWNSDLLAYAAVTKVAAPLAAGKYVVNFAADPAATNQPAGSGYATVTVSPAGGAVIAGKLADGTAFNGATSIAKGGQWPLYASLYNGKGVLIGWENLTNATGMVHWTRPSSMAGAYGGFSTVLSSSGGAYLRPATQGSYELTLENGPLQQPITANVSISATGVVTVNGALLNQLKMTFNPATALISGKYTPAGSSSMSLYGALIDATNGASGFFTNSTGVSGRFIVQ